MTEAADEIEAYVLDMFAASRYRSPMPDLRLATADEIAETLSFALRYQGRKRAHDADEAMARITAARLVRHLKASGFVRMKRPPGTAPTTSRMLPPID